VVLTLAVVLASSSLAGGGAVLAGASTARPAVAVPQPGCGNTGIGGNRPHPTNAEAPHAPSPQPAFTRGMSNTITWQPCPGSYWYNAHEVDQFVGIGYFESSTGRQYILNITNIATGQKESIYLPGGETESSYTVSGGGFPAATNAIDGTKFEYRLSTRQRICTNSGQVIPTDICEQYGYVYSEQTAPVSSTQDATAPELLTLTLDNGLAYTNQLTVPAHVSAVDPSRPGGVPSGLGFMQFSLSPTFGCPVLSVCASSYASNTTVGLNPGPQFGLGGLLGGSPPPGDGLRTVFARVFDLANYMPPSPSLLRPIFGGQPQGNVSNVLSASILLDTTGPKLVVTAKSSTHVGKPVSFDATHSSDPSPGSGIDAGTAVWRFGDGTVASGLAVTHRYHKTGKYTVTFSMKDNAGNESTLKIHIKVKALSVPVSGSAVTTTGTPSHHQPLQSSPAVRITRLSLGKRRGRFVLTLKLSKAASVIVELRRLSPHPSITLKELKRYLRGGTSELVLGSLRRHSREQVIVAILGGAANVSTTRTIGINVG
jgi:PKD domain